MSSPCPECGAQLPVDPALVTWCDACGWNLSAPEAPEPQTLLERLYAHAGLRVATGWRTAWHGTSRPTPV